MAQRLAAAIGLRQSTRLLESVAATGSRSISACPVAQNVAEDATTSGLPSLVVFGGSGYLGSRICQEALKAGLPVTGVSRSGRPANEDGAWCNEVTWHSANALYPESYTELLRNSLAVISTIGLISASQEDMLRMNGEANKALINAAADAGVGRFAYVSAHDYQFPGDLVLLRGYFQGKRDAEATLAARFPDSGVALRPGFIHGTRRWGTTKIPLSAIGRPLETVLSALPTESLAKVPVAGAAFVPPLSVQTVARAAVAAATDPSVPAGPMDVWQIATHK